MIQRAKASATLVLFGVLCTAAESQDTANAPYQPLFTNEMINSANPGQRERMRAAEESNRRAYERRQKASEEPAAAPVSAAPTLPKRAPRSKIYRWVDDKGRVHFGDAPAGTGAEEITVRGSAATPPSVPVPGSGSAPRSPSPDEPSRGGGDSRNQRRGS